MTKDRRSRSCLTTNRKGCNSVVDFHFPQNTNFMRIPHTKLSSSTLRAVVEEYVTRDGTDHSVIERRVDMVLCQLDDGRVELHFDHDTQTCNILPVEENPPGCGRNE